MKTNRIIYLLLCMVLTISTFLLTDVGILGSLNCKAAESYETKAQALLKSEIDLSGKFLDKIMKNPQSLPFTFVFKEKKIRGIPSSWNPITTYKKAGTDITKTTIRGTEPASKLKVTYEMTTYKDYPTVEWIVWFENKGSVKTPVISDITTMDYNFTGSSPSLTHCNGDFNNAAGYTVENTKLAGQTLNFEPTGGRSCDRAFPYYRLLFKDYGVTMAIGWPADWFANFTGTSKSVSVQSGQSYISTYLKPGEKIRSTSMTLLMFKNGEANGINLWRSWFRDHVLIKPDGKEIAPLYASSQNAQTQLGDEHTKATETNQLNFIDKYTEKGYDFNVWWIDAGWYYCYDSTENKSDWYRGAGNWYPDPARFPNGMKSISDKLQQNGQKLLMWFEPERVYPGTEIAKDHPEWLLKSDDGSSDPSYLLNMGNNDCRKWITNRIDKLIKDNGIGIYREDFNFQPLNYLLNYNKSDRIGIYENMFVQGFLQFWDDLQARNPGLIIDSCASGGRRNDMETMRRAVPLHYSDFGYGNTIVKQGFHDTIYQWFPYFKDNPISEEYAQANSIRDKDHQLDPNKNVDEFAAYVGMSPFYGSAVDITNNNYDFATHQKFKKYWEQVSKYLIDGDYYLFTKDTRKDDTWTVRQFDMPEKSEGIFQLFRNLNNKAASFTIKPKGSISTNYSYEISNIATGEKAVISGSDWLKNGFKVSLDCREACILKYSAILN